MRRKPNKKKIIIMTLKHWNVAHLNVYFVGLHTQNMTLHLQYRCLAKNNPNPQ